MLPVRNPGNAGQEIAVAIEFPHLRSVLPKLPATRSSPPAGRQSEPLAAAENTKVHPGIRRFSAILAERWLDGPGPRWLSLSTLTCNVVLVAIVQTPQAACTHESSLSMQDPRIDDILDIIAESAKLDRAKLKLETPLDELSISSLTLIEAVFEIESKYDVEIPTEQFVKKPDTTLGELIQGALARIDGAKPAAAGQPAE